MQGYILDQSTAAGLQQLLRERQNGGGTTYNSYDVAGVAVVSGIVGKVIAAPSGQTEYTNCRYWIQPQICDNSDLDFAAKPNFVASTDELFANAITATNLAEIASDSHSVAVGEYVYCIRICSQSAVINGYTQPGYRLWIFDRSLGGECACSGDPWVIDSSSTSTTADTTSIPDTQGRPVQITFKLRDFWDTSAGVWRGVKRTLTICNVLSVSAETIYNITDSEICYNT